MMKKTFVIILMMIMMVSVVSVSADVIGETPELTPCTVNSDCDDNNDCTNDICDTSKNLCSNSLKDAGTSCDDDNGYCYAGFCEDLKDGGEDCSANYECNTNSCVGGNCEYECKIPGLSCSANSDCCSDVCVANTCKSEIFSIPGAFKCLGTEGCYETLCYSDEYQNNFFSYSY